MSSTITEIEQLAKTLADARALVGERVMALDAEITAAKNRKLPGIKTAVATAKEADAKLAAALRASSDLFRDPRTIIAHGLKIGFAKGRGKIEWADEPTLIARIEKKFPEQADLLIKTEKSVRKKALAALTTAEVRALGCTVVEAGDHVYIAPVADDVEKLVSRLLKEDSTEETAAA